VAPNAGEQKNCRLVAVLKECVSGRELIDRGWESDVLIAGELEVSSTAPILKDGAYRDCQKPSFIKTD
jgi:phosphosulfolactate phosphohydrolase-like enzyme